MQCVAVRCSGMVAAHTDMLSTPSLSSHNVMHVCAAVCCSVLHCAAVCGSVLQCAAVSCSVLQCVVACCSVLQCVAAVLQKEKRSSFAAASLPREHTILSACYGVATISRLLKIIPLFL